jgi:hypothetical protein
LHLLQIYKMEVDHLFGRLGHHSADCLIIEQQVDPVHTLREEVFDLIQVRRADAEFFHSFMVGANVSPGKGKGRLI